MNKLCFIILFFISFGCEKVEDLSPSKEILGKWELIQMGNWPQMISVDDHGYTEFLADSSMILYYYDTTEFPETSKYWFDSVFNVSESYHDPGLKFKYDFYDNKLRLDILGVSANFETTIYKRIE